ncbi:MAG: hypothetical protein ACRD1K_18535 [Acidimicrobiales bacterium]
MSAPSSRAAAAGVMALALAGACGGGDGDRLTKAEFLKQANAICEKGNARIEEAGGDLSPESPMDQITSFIEDTALPETPAQFDDVDGLNPPEDIAGDVDQALAAVRRALDKVEDDPASLVEDGDEIFAEANKKLNGLGLGVCGDEDDEAGLPPPSG